MKAKSGSILGFVILAWLLQASSVLARGGGGVGGSLAKGFSSGRSLSSGLGHGFSGGFFPFFFFGGGGGASVISIIILLMIVVFVLRLLVRKRYYRPRNIVRSEQDWGNSEPVDFAGRPIKNERARFDNAINYTRKNMDYFAEKFPRWDYGLLSGRVRQVFYYLQDAWSRQDLSEGAQYFTNQLLDDYQAKLTSMRSRGERNVAHDPELSTDNIDFVYSKLESGDERFVARIFASLVDYTIDTSGRVIAGEQDNRLYFTEFWEFVWEDEQWKLQAIHQEDSLEVARWARGEL